MRSKTAIILLICGFFACKKKEPVADPVSACIEVERQSTFINDTVWFTSCAENTTQHQWDMGDGNHAEVRHTTHVYTEPGSYLVEHHVQNEFGETEYATEELTVHMLQLDSVTIFPTADTVTPTIHLVQDDIADLYLDDPLRVYSDRYVFAPTTRFLMLDRELYIDYYEYYTMYGYTIWNQTDSWGTTESVYDTLDEGSLSYSYANDSLLFSVQLHFSLYTP